METKLLDTFIMVADVGNFSAAATMLGVTQSIVSRRIGELESACGARLLYRHGRGVRLTLAGESLYESARPLVAQFASVLEGIASLDAQPSGAVGVAISPSLMSAVGLRLLEEMERLHPQIHLHLVTGYSRYVLEWLLQGRVDIGVLSDAGLSSQLHAEDLGSAPMVLSAHPDFALPASATAGEIKLGQLAGIPLIVPTKGQGLRKYLDVAAAKAGIVLNIAYEIDDISLTKDLIATGKAATVLSRLAIVKEVRAGTLLERRVVAPELRARSTLATALNRPVSAAMKAAITVLKTVTAELLVDT